MKEEESILHEKFQRYREVLPRAPIDGRMENDVVLAIKQFPMGGFYTLVPFLLQQRSRYKPEVIRRLPTRCMRSDSILMIVIHPRPAAVSIPRLLDAEVESPRPSVGFAVIARVCGESKRGPSEICGVGNGGKICDGDIERQSCR